MSLLILIFIADLKKKAEYNYGIFSNLIFSSKQKNVSLSYEAEYEAYSAIILKLDF